MKPLARAPQRARNSTVLAAALASSFLFLAPPNARAAAPSPQVTRIRTITDREARRDTTELGRWLLTDGNAAARSAAAVALGRSLPVVRGETIPMLAARFARAALYIGNDTGPLHLAGATGCPTVGIYGWSNPAEWAPVGRRVRSVRAADASLTSIPPEQVLEVALPLLEEAACV